MESILGFALSHTTLHFPFFPEKDTPVKTCTQSIVAVVTFMCLLVPAVLLGQQTTLMVGVGANGSFYTGDLQSSGNLQRVYPGGQLSIQSVKKSWFRISAEAGFGKYAAQGSVAGVPADVQPEGFVLAPYVFVDLKANFILLRNHTVEPYMAIGAGVFHFNPQDALGDPLVENPITRMPEETYNTSIFSLPLSAGMRFRIHKYMALGAEYSYRLTPTDYLDNVGLLGKRAGADRLQALSLSMYFFLAN